MATVIMRRHGDQMIKTYPGFKIPKQAKLAAVKVLFRGDNHVHKFVAGQALMGEFEGKRFLRVKKDATLDHEEHGRGIVPVGDYYVETKVEYDHWSEESRQVID